MQPVPARRGPHPTLTEQDRAGPSVAGMDHLCVVIVSTLMQHSRRCLRHFDALVRE